MIVKYPNPEDSPFSLIQIFPFIDGELTPQNAWSARIEIFPEELKNSPQLEGKRIRYQSGLYSREDWNRLSEAMEKAFEIEAETAK